MADEERTQQRNSRGEEQQEVVVEEEVEEEEEEEEEVCWQVKRKQWNRTNRRKVKEDISREQQARRRTA